MPESETVGVVVGPPGVPDLVTVGVSVAVGETEGETEAVSQMEMVAVGEADSEGVCDDEGEPVSVPVSDADAVGPASGASERPAAPSEPSRHEQRTVRLRRPSDAYSAHDVHADVCRARQTSGFAGGSEQSEPP